MYPVSTSFQTLTKDITERGNMMNSLMAQKTSTNSMPTKSVQWEITLRKRNWALDYRRLRKPRWENGILFLSGPKVTGA